MVKRSESNYIIYEETDSKIVLKDIGPWNIYTPLYHSIKDVIQELGTKIKNKHIEFIDENDQHHIVIIEDGIYCGTALKHNN